MIVKFLGILALIFCAATSNKCRAEGTLFHLEQDVDLRRYSIDVVETGSRESYKNNLKVKCVLECGIYQEYSEDIAGEYVNGGYLVGNRMLLISSAASAFWVRIFILDGDLIKKVLDRPTHTLPIDTVMNGKGVIILRNDMAGDYLMNPDMTEEEKRKTQEELTEYWIWDDGAYKPFLP